MNANDFYPSKTSHRAMAASVLKQAKKDLRRFYRGINGAERELYLDAYEWIVSDDCSWPFSFVNVCDLMGLEPARLRQELISDLSLGPFSYWMQRCRRAADRVQIFANSGDTDQAQPGVMEPLH